MTEVACHARPPTWTNGCNRLPTRLRLVFKHELKIYSHFPCIKIIFSYRLIKYVRCIHSWNTQTKFSIRCVEGGDPRWAQLNWCVKAVWLDRYVFKLSTTVLSLKMLLHITSWTKRRCESFSHEGSYSSGWWRSVHKKNRETSFRSGSNPCGPWDWICGRSFSRTRHKGRSLAFHCASPSCAPPATAWRWKACRSLDRSVCPH